MSLYGWLLRCYPPAFRARFEDGMRDAFSHEHADARRRGLRAVAAFWCVTAGQAVLFGLAERGPVERVSVTKMPSVDWRDAWRSLRAAPVITLVAILSLALGTGANTALFSILNSMLYKSLPVREASRLALLDKGSWTNPIWEQIRDRQAAFSDGAFAWCASRFDLSAQGQTDYVPGAYVSGAMYEVLGVKPALGRLIAPQDDLRGRGTAGLVAVLGYDFWQRRFGGATDVVGRTLTVQRVKFTIIGVSAQGFFGPDVGSNLAVAIPVAANEAIRGNAGQLNGRSSWWLEIMTRLRPGQTPEQAAVILNDARSQIRTATAPPNWRPQDLETYLKDPWQFVPAGTGVSDLRGRYRDPLKVLLAIVAIVLVIACANIANVLIARSTTRRHELCLRLALGATRWRLAKQLLVESLMMAAAGAGLGLLFAQWASALLVRQISTATYLALAPDLRVLLFTAGVAVATALLFGVAPSLGVLAVSPNEVLKERGRSVAGDARFGIRNALVIAQVALSLALVVGAGLFVRTFSTLTSRPLGFDVDPVLVASVNVRRSSVPPEARPALLERLRQTAAAVPGVQSAATSFTTPIGNSRWNTLLVLPDQPALSDRERTTWVNAVSPGWFHTYGIKIAAGRDFDEHDSATSPKVAVVTRGFAKKFYRGADPVGQPLLEEDGPKSVRYDVVGVVEDAAYESVRGEMPPILYLSLAQTIDADLGNSVELSVNARSSAVEPLVRPLADALTAVEPNLSVTMHPLAQNVSGALRQERLVAMTSGFFGGLALLLAGLGLYGVTSYSVSRRRSEIGIRMALGARPERIVRLVISRAIWLVGAGIVAGAVVSLWAVRYVTTLLYGVDARDPMTIVAAIAALALVGLAAAWLPARRASRIDPAVTLRTE